MKTLLLIRHAKSSWDDAQLPDHERPLAPRGLRAARRMGRLLAKRAVKVDHVLSSPALRAHATAKIIAKKLGYKPKRIALDERLYETSPRHLLSVIADFGDDLRNVMLVGHNPEFSGLVRLLCKQQVELPTCAVVTLAYETEHWQALDKAHLVSVSIDYPRRRSAKARS